MGQKVNPVIIRQSIPNLKSNTSIWFSKKNTYRSLLFQNFEITNFINFLFKTWGIFIRNCLIFRNNNLLCLNLDLYFNYRLAKERLFLERKNFFFCFQKTIPIINQPKVMKEFIFDLKYFSPKFLEKFIESTQYYFTKFLKLQKIYSFQNFTYTFLDFLYSKTSMLKLEKILYQLFFNKKKLVKHYIKFFYDIFKKISYINKLNNNILKLFIVSKLKKPKKESS